MTWPHRDSPYRQLRLSSCKVVHSQWLIRVADSYAAGISAFSLCTLRTQCINVSLHTLSLKVSAQGPIRWSGRVGQNGAKRRLEMFVGGQTHITC